MKKYLLFLFLIVFTLTQSISQTHTWTGNGDNIFWSDPNNWDQGTIPLTNGVGTVIIPEGFEVTASTIINFEYGEFKGGGTLINAGIINIINSDEVLTSKVFSNITIKGSAEINIYRAEGITNTDPVLLNEGALIIKYGQNTPGTELTLDGIGISFNTPLPGVIEVNGAINKIGPEDVLIDVEMINFFYNINVLEGLLILNPFTSNTFISPDFFIAEGAGLILKGNNIFDGSGGDMGGNIEGTLEITNDEFSNPSVYENFAFNAEGEIILNNVTFQGDGTLHLFTDIIIPESSIVTFDESVCYNRNLIKTSSQSEIILKNNGELINGAWSNMIINGGSITSLNNEQFKNWGIITIAENSTLNINGVYFKNSKTLDLQTGNLIMDNDSFFEGYYNEIIDPYGVLIDIHYSEILGSGFIKYPTNSPQNNENNGFLKPGPDINTINTENYAQTEIGYLQIDIESLTNFDKIINTGTTYFEGNIEVLLSFSPNIGDEFIIYQSDTPLTNCQPVSTTSAVYNNFNYVFDVICNSDHITLKLSEILSNDNFELSNNSFYCYPNPVSSVTTFNISPELLTSENNSILIYNFLGQKVRELEIKNNSSLDFEKGNLPSGIYFAKLKSDSTSTIKILIE